jgi:hypothetical protein
MQIKKIWIAHFIIILLILPVLTITASSEDSSIPTWNKNWSYRQEIILPISTGKPQAKFQPIDIHIEFTSSCWAKNENEHSIRVCCWDGNRWYELESQIYDLEFKDTHHINKCGLVFLIPEMANGEEQYFVYYDNNEKPSPNYLDHVSIEDAYYYYEPISGISLEGDYYKIEENGFGVYAIGQKGKIINRPLSQVIMSMKPGTKEFDVSNSDNIASMAFGYNDGVNDEDQIASDYSLVSKDILIDGNLMVEFRIVSESSGKEIRTTNIFKYYYCPTDNKRICVSVKHEMFKEGIVKGQENVDGIFGGLVSYRSRSERIKRMNFGEILPYLHIYGENNQIKEYIMDQNPQSKEREWIIPYTDDCDLGQDAWISYDEGESGKAFGILFSSNKNIVIYGKNERDGIQVKSAEKEYLDVLGAEIDYAAVLFGRNSYEKGGSHDLTIAADLVVEFDTELFTSLEGGYNDVILESEYFRALSKHRQHAEDGSYLGDENIYTLTVIPRFTGDIFSFPFISNKTGVNILKIFGELYKDDKLVSESFLTRTLFGHSKIKFPKLASGDYILFVYRKIGNRDKKIIGLEAVNIEGDTTIKVNCTWQKNIQITAKDQNGQRIDNVELSLLKNDKLLLSNLTDDNCDITMKVSYNYFESYILKANYKGFTVYYKEIPIREKNLDIILVLYTLTIDVKDELGFSPGINLRPFLTSSEMDTPIELTPEVIEDGTFVFKNLLPARYRLYISYGRFSDEIYINLPEDGDSASIKFSATFNLGTVLFDTRGNQLEDTDLKYDIKRDGKILFQSISPDKVITLPPGKYTVDVYSDGRMVGFETVELTNDKEINIVTKIEPILPTLITGLILVFIIEIFVLIIFKRISLNVFLKLLAIALIVLSLIQPWWILNANSDNPLAERTSEMFIIPQKLVRTTTYEDQTYLELATLPKMFTDFVGTLLFIICSGIILVGLSFIPNILLKRRFSIGLISASIIFLILVSLAFSLGMSIICEISVGSLNGQGPLDIMLPNGETVIMSSSWGLGLGFYLCIISALILISTGVIDFLNKKNWPKKLFIKK